MVVIKVGVFGVELLKNYDSNIGICFRPRKFDCDIEKTLVPKVPTSTITGDACNFIYG